MTIHQVEISTHFKRLSSKLKPLIILFLITFFLNISAKTSGLNSSTINLSELKDTLEKSGNTQDTMLHFNFQPILVEAEYNFKNKRPERRYLQLYNDIKRTYPLAMTVSKEMKMLNAKLDFALKKYGVGSK